MVSSLNMNRRRVNNEISGLEIDGQWFDEVPVVKKAVKDHFQKQFCEDIWERPTLDGIDFAKLSEQQSASLVTRIDESEIKEAISECGSSKSPGPDGFNFKFIKALWDLLKEVICSMVEEFHENGKFPKGSNASFLVLIPKKDKPIRLNDYRPISLIGCIYKIIAKILAKRLAKVLPAIISECQSAFVGHRQILDGVLIANEIIHQAS